MRVNIIFVAKVCIWRHSIEPTMSCTCSPLSSTAVNGEVSAEILRLPNQNLFDYLKRQYAQQSSKLSEEAFARSSWEMVRPEV